MYECVVVQPLTEMLIDSESEILRHHSDIIIIIGVIILAPVRNDLDLWGPVIVTTCEIDKGLCPTNCHVTRTYFVLACNKLNKMDPSYKSTLLHLHFI